MQAEQTKQLTGGTEPKWPKCGDCLEASARVSVLRVFSVSLPPIRAACQQEEGGRLCELSSNEEVTHTHTHTHTHTQRDVCRWSRDCAPWSDKGTCTKEKQLRRHCCKAESAVEDILCHGVGWWRRGGETIGEGTNNNREVRTGGGGAVCAHWKKNDLT